MPGKQSMNEFIKSMKNFKEPKTEAEFRANRAKVKKRRTEQQRMDMAENKKRKDMGR